MSVGSSLSLVVNNIFMEHFEEKALDTLEQKPSLCLRYVEDTFLILPHGLDSVQEFCSLINNLKTYYQVYHGNRY